MKTRALIGAGLLSVAIGLYVSITLNGDGGLRRMVTISGIYTVADPGGYPVVCFVDKGSRAMDCLPRGQIQ